MKPIIPEVSVWDPPLESVEAEPSALETSDGIQLSPSIIIPANQKDIEVRVTHVTSPANICVQLVQYSRQLKRYRRGNVIGTTVIVAFFRTNFQSLKNVVVALFYEMLCGVI